MPHLQFLVKPVSSLCDLKCDYCFYHDLAGHQQDKPRKMKQEVLSLLMDRAAEYFMEAQANASATSAAIDGQSSVSFLFQGGEPTLAGLEFFKAVIAEQKRAFAKLGARVPVFNSIQTNACNLTDELVAFLTTNNFFFGVSLDGPEHVHDAMRVHRNGTGSYQKVMQGIELLRRYGAEFNVLCVLTNLTTEHTKEVYDFYKANGFYNLQFIACLDGFSKTPPHPCSTDPKPAAIPFQTVAPSPTSTAPSAQVSPATHSIADSYNQQAVTGVKGAIESVAAATNTDGKRFLSDEAYGKFLVEIFDLFYADLTERGEYISIRHIENYLAMCMGMNINACNMTGVCSIQNVIESTGKVYPCDFYCHDDFLLGDLHSNTIREIMSCARAQQFVEFSKHLSQECRNCSYFKFCRGGCVRERADNTNIRCTAFKHFFSQRLPQLQHAAAILQRSQS